ncbi:hypothetical protein [Jannaschia sp. LMIT008]|uniref:hypothetical protein n=1 Tax=Jannaschia maritima TaxID=3032585 RepID=UPI002812724F|nr:hypothetical protein [Jannaschia sp. LMIT008]
MLGLVRLLLLIVVVQTIVYAFVGFYLRASLRERLEARWERERPPLPRDRFVQNGLDAARPRHRRWLIGVVYVVPLVFLVGLIAVLEAV